jgi:hypothetical protein
MEQIVSKVAKELNLPEKLVKKVYNDFWFAIKNNIQGIPLRKDITKEEFDKLRTSFNIPSLGKLYISYNQMVKINSHT